MMMSVPKLLRARSTVITCAACGAWYTRIPAFMGDALDKGDQCERCGATSFRYREGRPLGPKSQHWNAVLADWSWVYQTLVETPEFKELLGTATYEEASETKGER